MTSAWDLDAFDWITPVLSACKIGSGDLRAAALQWSMIKPFVLPK
jgi:hypothetical protein